jgi:hypothetical protein
MKTLNMNEIEEVAGGFPIGALPLVVVMIPTPDLDPDAGASN